MEKTDKELILEHYNGDADALAVLFERHKNRIFNFCLRFLENRADAEDATSEVFMKLLNKKYEIQNDAKLSTWMFTVARNSCLNKVRKDKRTTSLWYSRHDGASSGEREIEDTQDISSEMLEKRETKLKVIRAIRKLPSNQKQALILREYHHMNYEEISIVLNCSLDNVKVLIFRAREQLRNHLSPLLKGDDHA